MSTSKGIRLTVDPSGRVHPSNDKPTLSGLLIIKSDHPADEAIYEEVSFTASGNDLKWDGTISNISSTTNGLFSPSSGRRWYVRGMLGGSIVKASGRPTGVVQMAVQTPPHLNPTAHASHGTTEQIDVPFVSDWVELELRTIDGDPANFHGGALDKLVFKPKGAILRIQPGNTLPGGVVLNSLRLRSEAFSADGTFDFQTNAAGDNSLPFTHPSSPAYDHSWTTISGWSIPTTGTRANPSYSANWYWILWVMPRPGTQPQGARGLSAWIAINNPSGGSPITFESAYSGTTKQIKHGATYRLLLPIKRPKMALEYMGWASVGNTPGSWAPDFNVVSSGVYTFSTAQAALPAGTHIPSDNEWYSVFGSKYRDVGYPTSFNVTEHNVPCEWGGMTANFSEQWRKSANTYHWYALRYIGQDSRYIAAYRYGVGGVPGPNPTMIFPWNVTQSYVHIRARYLGPNYPWHAGLIDQIANETFWAGNWDGEEQVRFLNSVGWLLAGTNPPRINTGQALYWTSTPLSGYPKYYRWQAWFLGQSSIEAGAQTMYGIRPWYNQ